MRYLQEKEEITEVEDITLAACRKFSLHMVSNGKKGTYVNGILKTAKSFIQYCFDEGYGGFNTKKNFKWCKEEKPIIATFKPTQVRQMLSSCNGNDYLGFADKLSSVRNLQHTNNIITKTHSQKLRNLQNMI